MVRRFQKTHRRHTNISRASASGHPLQPFTKSHLPMGNPRPTDTKRPLSLENFEGFDSETWLCFWLTQLSTYLTTNGIRVSYSEPQYQSHWANALEETLPKKWGQFRLTSTSWTLIWDGEIKPTSRKKGFCFSPVISYTLSFSWCLCIV